MAGLRKRGIGFQSLHESLDTTTPSERPVFHVFAALAKFIRELIVQGTHEGLAAARALSGTDRPPAGHDGETGQSCPRPADGSGEHDRLDRRCSVSADLIPVSNDLARFARRLR
ncbi:recombinase family protein [Streptomyces sp. NPDC058430]|uniref:recombinase family protein n=1 Tax=Streptomyces sp. NPDC058430 TaxID=3346495 RepID=UPI00364BF216